MREVLSGCNIIGHGLFGSMEISSTPPINYDNIEMEGIGSLTLPNSLKAPIDRLELLGNSVQGENPTLENPQEIKSAGRKSRNLFDISRFPLEHDEEVIIIKPTDVTAKLIDGNELEENTRYIVWFESYENTQTENTDAPLIEIVYADGTKSEIYVHRNFYIKTDASKNVSYIWLRNPWKSGCKLSRLQIEKGNSISQYEPYGNDLLDVQVSGRNLINIDALRNENGYVSGAYEKSRDIDPFKIVKGKKYLLITKGRPLTVSDYSSVYFGDETLKYPVNNLDTLATAVGYVSFSSDLKQNRVILTAKKTATITKMILHGARNTRKDDYDVVEFGLFEMLDDDWESILYEQYKEPQTTQIALDEPLRGIGQYKDIVSKDGIVRNIAECKLADYLQKDIYGQPGGKYIFSEAPNCYINYDRNRCISSVGFTTNKEDITYVPVPYLDKFKIGVQDADTIETIREKIKDVVVLYTVKEQVTEQLQTELGNLHTYNGTTIVSVDSGEVETGIKLTYRKEK